MLARIGKWYEGEYKVYDNDPRSSVVIFAGWQERHWTSNAAHVLVEFYFREWKWIIGTGIALAGLVFAYIKLG